MNCATGREAANHRDGNPPAGGLGQCPPGGMQILIDPESHEITIVTSQDVNRNSSNRTDEASGGADVAYDNEEEVEETDSDGSGRRR